MPSSSPRPHHFWVPSRLPAFVCSTASPPPTPDSQKKPTQGLCVKSGWPRQALKACWPAGTDWRCGPRWAHGGTPSLGPKKGRRWKSLAMFTPRSTLLCWTRMTTAPGSTTPLTWQSVCLRTAPWASTWPLSRPGTQTLAAMGRWVPMK